MRTTCAEPASAVGPAALSHWTRPSFPGCAKTRNPYPETLKASRIEVQLDFTPSLAACGRPETWFGCSSPGRAARAGPSAVGGDASCSSWHGPACWVPACWLIQLPHGRDVARWRLGWFLTRICEGFGMLKEKLQNCRGLGPACMKIASGVMWQQLVLTESLQLLQRGWHKKQRLFCKQHCLRTHRLWLY